MTAQEDIDEYIAFFRGKTAEISRIEAHPIFRKILYLVEIDTLSRAAFPSEKGHKNRVIKFLDECSNWSARDRVSAIQLKLILEKNGKSSGALFGLIKSRVDSWNCGTIIYPSQDLTFGEVQSLACSDVSKIVDEARYDRLFYEYRNTLIHEFREPGTGMDLRTDSASPYYLGIDHQSTGESSWELVFPEKFLERLCEGCINGLERYLPANNLNPYGSYKFGTLWQRS